MAKDFIVAIELGSSKMTGIAGRKNPDGSIVILASASEDSALYIRKGTVYNIDKTAQGLSNIISKLKNTLQTDITQVYVGIGGQSIRSVKNVIIKDLPLDAIVSQDMVNELMDTNRNMTYPDYEIQDAITEEYKVDSQYQADPVGIQAIRLEGNFLNILWRRSFYRNLNKSFDNAGIAIAETYLAPVVMADNVLTEAEKRAGCVLVDLGAETTTVSVYYRDKLRNIAVIPLGINNVVKDLESLQMDEAEATAMMRKYGAAYTDVQDIDPNMMWSIDGSRTVNSCKFIEVVEARMTEIIENVRNLIPTEYIDKLLGGLVLTGGGSNMRNIEKAFRRTISVDKVRVAKFVNLNINTKESKVRLAADGTMNTILSLVGKGDMSCAGNSFNMSLFDDSQSAATTTGASCTTTAGASGTATSVASGTTTSVASGTAMSGTGGTTTSGASGTATSGTGGTTTAGTGGTTTAGTGGTATTSGGATTAVQPEPKPEEPEPKPGKSLFGKLLGSLKQFGRSLVEPDTNE